MERNALEIIWSDSWSSSITCLSIFESASISRTLWPYRANFIRTNYHCRKFQPYDFEDCTCKEAWDCPHHNNYIIWFIWMINTTSIWSKLATIVTHPCLHSLWDSEISANLMKKANAHQNPLCADFSRDPDSHLSKHAMCEVGRHTHTCKIII